MTTLHTDFTEAVRISPVSMRQETQILKDLDKRYTEFCIHHVQYAANILHPNYQGKHLTEEENDCGHEFIAKLVSDSPKYKPYEEVHT